MRNRIILFTIYIFCNFTFESLHAQNLVPNSGFEVITTQPIDEGRLVFATPWQPLLATPDLFYQGQNTIPSIACNWVDVPNNAGGYANGHNNSKGYAGLQFDFTNDYMEYISVPLSIPMVGGQLYRVEFYTQLADKARYAIDKLGALLTNNIPSQPGTSVIPILPPANMESSVVISDTTGWVLVSSIYQAFGGENYLTIGLFRDRNDPAITKIDLGNKNPSCAKFATSAFYYIDDVSVTPIVEQVAIVGDTIICPGDTATLSSLSNVPVWWSEQSTPFDTLSLSNSIQVNPSIPTTYYLHGITQTVSVNVTITNPPIVNLGPDSTICEGSFVQAIAATQGATAYLWSTGDTTSTLNVSDSGTYWVKVTNLGCAVSDTIHYSGYLSNPPFTLGEDSIYCFFTFDTLKLDAGDGISYLWTPTGDTTRSITVLKPDTLTVKRIIANGCSRTASLQVAEVCVPLIYVPSAFSPDGDGLNDIFKPTANNLNSYNLRILNRWGQTVFYTENPDEGWDGTTNGKPATVDVYVYRINYRGLDESGDKLKGRKFGTITLIR